MEQILDRAYRGFRFLIDGVVGYGATLVMLGATCLAIVEVLRRYLIGEVYHWGQDAVTYLMVGAVFLFFAVTQARRSHLAMTAGLDWLKSRGHLRLLLALRLVGTSIALCFFSALAYWGVATVERTQALGRLTQSMMLPLWPFQLCLLIGFGLMAIASLFHLYQDFQAVRGRTVFPWSPVEEGLEI